jgi:hypothetical protein
VNRRAAAPWRTTSAQSAREQLFILHICYIDIEP